MKRKSIYYQTCEDGDATFENHVRSKIYSHRQNVVITKNNIIANCIWKLKSFTRDWAIYFLILLGNKKKVSSESNKENDTNTLFCLQFHLDKRNVTSHI